MVSFPGIAFNLGVFLRPFVPDQAQLVRGGAAVEGRSRNAGNKAPGQHTPRTAATGHFREGLKERSRLGGYQESPSGVGGVEVYGLESQRYRLDRATRLTRRGARAEAPGAFLQLQAHRAAFGRGPGGA